MSAMRHDPPHRSGPLERSLPGSGRRRAAVGPGAFLSVVVPAKNEAASLPQLVDEIARALRPLQARSGGRLGLAGFEVMVVDDGSTDDTPAGPRQTRPRLSRAEGGHSGGGTRASRRRRPRASARREGTGWRRSTPTSRTTRPTWRGSGTPCPATTRPSGGGSTRGRLVEAGDQPLGEPGPQRRARPVDPRHRLLGPDLPARGGAAPADVPRVHRFLGPLLLREGCRVVQVPVNHRPRPHGRSHYNLWNRSLRVVVDLFGVAWLMRRAVRYEVAARRGRRVHPRPSPRPVTPSGGRPEPCDRRRALEQIWLVSASWARGSSPRGSGPVGRLGEEARLGRAGGVLVAEPGGRPDHCSSYAIHRETRCSSLGQGMGLFVYVRNLMLVAGKRRRKRAARRHGADRPSATQQVSHQ